MGHSASQTPNGIHLPRLLKFAFEPEPLSNIVIRRDKMRDLPIFAAHGRDYPLDCIDLSVFFAIADGSAKNVSRQNRLPHAVKSFRSLILRFEDQQCFPNRLVTGVAS